jgi:hypothetical protein
MFEAIRSRNINLKVRWMPSHVLDKKAKDPTFQIPSDVTPLDIEMNTIVDELAGDAARITELPLNVTSVYLRYYFLIRHIQNRNAAIIMSLPERPKYIPKQRDIIESLDDCISSSSHTIFYAHSQSSLIVCADCHGRHRLGLPGCKAWIQSYCAPTIVNRHVNMPTPVHCGDIHKGNTRIHGSHLMFHIGQLVFCSKCGSYSIARVKKLGSECLAPTDAGQKFLDNAKEGVFPSGEYMDTQYSNIEKERMANWYRSLQAKIDLQNLEQESEESSPPNSDMEIDNDVIPTSPPPPAPTGLSDSE